MTSTWLDILANGVATIPGPLPKAVWTGLYRDFDRFAASVAELPQTLQAYNLEAKEWQRNSGLKEAYGSYFSPYFRDTTKQDGRDRKRTIQFCEPYYRYLHERQSPLLENDLFRRLIEGMMAALYSSLACMCPALHGLRELEPKLYDLMNPEGVLPPVSITLLSYDRDGQHATNPHVDKSAITAIVDSDDPDTDQKLVFCRLRPDGTPLTLGSFSPARKSAGDSLVFLGAAPRVGGFSRFLPMPHAVRPFTGVVRHSAVFFWHLPGVDMERFDTTVEFEDDLGTGRIMVQKDEGSVAIQGR